MIKSIYILFFSICILVGCQGNEFQKRKATQENQRRRLDKYLENVDKEWHFLFRDTLNNGYTFNLDTLEACIKEDSLNITQDIKRKYDNVSNDSLIKLKDSLNETIYFYFSNQRNKDSVVNLYVNLLMLGVSKRIDIFFVEYAIYMEPCSSIYIKKSCNKYKCYLYGLHALALNKKVKLENISLLYIKHGKLDNLRKIWELRSKNGNEMATMNLFKAYYDGNYETKIDTSKAMDYLKWGMENKNPAAFYEYAEIALNKQDSLKAFDAYLKAYELYDSILPKHLQDLRTFSREFQGAKHKLKTIFPEKLKIHVKNIKDF